MLTLGSAVNFHIHHSPSHRHHAGCAGTGFRPAWENAEELWDEVDRGPQGKDMVPIDAISHIAGHGPLRELCSLFVFVSPFPACVCIHARGLVSPVLMWVCVCVCVFLAQGRGTDEGVRRGTAK